MHLFLFPKLLITKFNIMASDAVNTELISRVIGYKITKGDFSNITPNLPQRIAIIGEANTANQSGLTIDPVEITSAQQAGELFGYGSPIYNVMRILRPMSGDGIGGVPTIVYPQITGTATAKKYTVTVTGTATGNNIHDVEIAGRTLLDGSAYAVNVVVGDTPTAIASKIADAINAVLGSPVTATAAVGVVTITSKWSGLTSEDIKVLMNTNGNGVGVTYAIVSTQSGSGTPSTILASLELFGNNWNTIVVNTYGVDPTVMTILEQYNGVPDPVTPTGRYSGIIMKPFIALTGSTKSDDAGATDPRKNEVTIAICPAPLSNGLPMEAAANMALLFGRTAQDTPHLDVAGRTYSDMPTPSFIGSMDTYANRDYFVKKGNSTVDLIGGKYRVQDFVTTYHPVGELVPQFRYCRNLMLDFNIRFGYYLLEQINVVDKAIAADDAPVAVAGIVKPKGWKAVLFTYATNLEARALIVDASFMQKSLVVNLGTTNPDRLETFFRYKRTGIARISSTTAQAGFNFGTL
jgi:phage tail sheath gpL-like